MFNLPILSTLEALLPSFKGVLLDAYGVFWGGNQMGLLPGTQSAMQRLVTQGKIVGILSNTTQLVDKEIHKLQQYGLQQGKDFHFLVTSGEIARALFVNQKLPFATPKKKFWLLGEIHPCFASHHPIFQGTIYQETSDLQEADFIYIAIPHIKGKDQTDSAVFQKQLQALRETQLPMVCSNPDCFAHEGYPPQAVVRQGSLAVMYEELGGKVFYIGKPYRLAYLTAMEFFASYHIYEATDVLMVGDNPQTDIRGAKEFGMPAALVTQTGLMAEYLAHQGWEKTFKDLTLEERPHFFIERLA